MVEDGTSDDNTTTNKGVNVHSDSLPARVHRYQETDTSSTLDVSNRSITDIKNEIQTVLDLMGPTTPNVTSIQNTSSEADNEESIMSVPPKQQKRHSRGSPPDNRSQSSSARKNRSGRCSKESSSSSEENKDSILADIGTFSNNNFDTFEDIEHSCCDHNHGHTNPECICMMYVNQNAVATAPSKTCEAFCSPSTKITIPDCKKRGFLEWLRERSSELILNRSNCKPCELYKINICGQDDYGCPPKRVVFDLVEGIPKPSSNTVATNTIHNPVEKMNRSNCNCKEMKNMKNENITNRVPEKIQKNIYFDSDGNTRVDYYYFDHGNAQFFHTTDTPPVMKCEMIAEKTERYTTKFWAEFFASVHIGVSFCISFILQLFKFLLYSILRPLCVGILQTGSDYFFKPFLTTVYNGLIQPFLIFLYNVATSVRDLCDPIAEAVGYFWKEMAVLFRAIRLCTYKKNTGEDTNCDCVKKHKCEC